MEDGDIQVGDRVLVKKLFGNVFHAHILAIKKGLFGKKYYAEWRVNSDFGKYTTAGVFRPWNIISKN